MPTPPVDPGVNRQVYVTPMGWRGGLNLRSARHTLREDQLLIAQNTDIDEASGAVLCRGGSYRLYNSGFPFSTTLIIGATQAAFVIANAIVKMLVVASGTALSARAAADSAWTTITGALVLSAPTGNRVRFGQMNNLLIGFDGTNAPWKWAGAVASPAVALGGSPPTGELCFEWNGYWFTTRVPATPNRIHYSAVNDPETHPAANYFDVPTPFDGDPIMGYGFTYGNLLIFKRNSIYIVTGKTPSEWKVDKLNASFGIISVQATCQVENTCWFVTERGPYEINGVNISPVGYWVEPLYSNTIAPAAINNPTYPICIHYHKAKNQVWVSYPSISDLPNYLEAVIHWNGIRDDIGQPATTRYVFPAGFEKGTPYILMEFDTKGWNINNDSPSFASGATVLVGVCADTSLKLRTYNRPGGGSDDGVSLTPMFQTKYYDMGNARIYKRMRNIRLDIHAPTENNAFTALIYYGDNVSQADPAVSVTVSSILRSCFRYLVPAGAKARFFSAKVTMPGVTASGVVRLFWEYMSYGARE